MSGYGVELVANWLTPTVLFCLLNLMIGTIFMRSKIVKPRRNPQSAGEDNNDEQPRQLGRVPGFFERVKSFNLSRYQFDQPGPDHHHAAVVPAQEQQHAVVHHEQDPEEVEKVVEEFHPVTRSKSHPVKKKKAATPPAKKVLKKSVSERMTPAGKMDGEEEEEDVDRRRPATVRERTAAGGGEDDAAVDAKADDFISRFRQQLKLQRLDSILRYKDMLNRGAER
ncbi:hypothetical protein ABFS83_10G050000 [Erythranthe nasuta]